jgi:hypothetical protein
MTAVPFAARFTWVVEAPSEGTVSGVPSLPVKFTSNEAGELVELVKYRAEYQPPPNANCGSTLDAVRAADWICGLVLDVTILTVEVEKVVVFVCAQVARARSRQPESRARATTRFLL